MRRPEQRVPPHADELLPTAGEIIRWLDQVAVVAARLADQVDAGRSCVGEACRECTYDQLSKAGDEGVGGDAGY